MNVKQLLSETADALGGSDEDRIRFIEKWVPVLSERVQADAQRIAFLELELSAKEDD